MLWEVTGGDPARDYYGCSLSDLTGFAGEPPATSRAHYGRKAPTLQAQYGPCRPEIPIIFYSD